MDEPVLIFQSGFTDAMKQNLKRFHDVAIVEAPPSPRNMTCRKGEAMLLADTDYITWADCDGFFKGNCSSRLSSPDPDAIHLRMRLPQDNAKVFQNAHLYETFDPAGRIPEKVLSVWRDDVGERSTPRLETCASACFFSIHRSHRDFIERWQLQMDRYLPNKNSGVTNFNGGAYFQLDESVLNSLLCYMDNAPHPVEYMLNKNPEALFYHMISTPKPWQYWGAHSIRFYDNVMRIVAWAAKEDLIDFPLPFALRERYRLFHRCGCCGVYAFKAWKKLRRRFS